jgi:serine/threonine protein kinase
LSGRPPFDGVDDKEIIKNVKAGQYSLAGAEWKAISKEAVDLVKKMLTYDYMSRISAEDCLVHPWIKKKAHE